MMRASSILIRAMATLLVVAGSWATAEAQEGRRYRYDSTMPPGAIGQRQRLRRQAMRDYWQPIRLVAPAGAQISIYRDGEFQDLESDQVTLGMLIGPAYRLKVTHIPGQPGLEVFPSVELINRLYPPSGLETKFPIIVHLAKADLETAANGAIVTRIVYLEDPQRAIPRPQDPNDQPYFDVSPKRDPLKVAQQIGRPMAMVRCGSRIPSPGELHDFSFGGPPLQVFNVEQQGGENQGPQASQAGPNSPRHTRDRETLKR